MTRRRSFGFTIVELNLALIFVAILLLAVATTAIYAGKLYQKGLSLKMVNQTGRQVVDQMRRDIAQAPSSRIQIVHNGATHRLCLGGISYIYNDAAAINDIANPTGQIIRSGPASSSVPVILARVVDQNDDWCQNSGALMNLAADADYVEMLQPDASIPLAIHKFEIAPIAQSGDASASQQALFQLVIELGTNERNTVSGQMCRPPTDNTSNFDYCAIREFNTIIRTRGDV